MHGQHSRFHDSRKTVSRSRMLNPFFSRITVGCHVIPSMHGSLLHRAFLTALALWIPGLPPASRASDDWHHWRGPRATGFAPDANPPLIWSESENVRWKTLIPGIGASTPIVSGNRIFLLSAEPTNRAAASPAERDSRALTEPPAVLYRFMIVCVDRRDGSILWRRVVREEAPHEGTHPTHSYAGGSPTTDGTRLFAAFGSRGVHCFDLDGNKIWERDLGRMRTRYGWGEAFTPVLHGNVLVVPWDHEDQSFVIALDAGSGVTLWKKLRDEPSNWSTPLIVRPSGETGVQVILNGTNRVRAYDVAGGDLVWECGGQTVNAIPSPVSAAGVVYCMSGYRGSAVVAIPLNSTGDVTADEGTVWSSDRAAPYVASPLLWAGRLYFTHGLSGVMTVLDASTGAPIVRAKRLAPLKNVYASPLGANGRVYLVDRAGACVVLSATNALEVLAVNHLDDVFDASPVALNDELFLRGKASLYCLKQASTDR